MCESEVGWKKAGRKQATGRKCVKVVRYSIAKKSACGAHGEGGPGMNAAEKGAKSVRGGGGEGEGKREGGRVKEEERRG